MTLKDLLAEKKTMILQRWLDRIIDQVLRPVSIEEDRAILEPVMKVRALENLPPSQGMRFILPLREVLSDILKEEL